MKRAYPIIMTNGKNHIVVYIPDFDINTQGADIADAMKMARDAIGLVGIDMQDDGLELPCATDIEQLKAKDGIISFVDVDFGEYRRKYEMRSVKKNCTIPSWLNYEAEKHHINFSETLQNALMEQLQIKR